MCDTFHKKSFLCLKLDTFNFTNSSNRIICPVLLIGSHSVIPSTNPNKIAFKIVGLFFDDYFNALFYNYQTVAIALIVFGILFIIIEDINKNRKPKVKRLGDITYPIAHRKDVFLYIWTVKLKGK